MSFIGFSFISNAQVGINTTTPDAQLEIKSSNQATPANTDGILLPKIDAFPVVNPTSAQDGMMVYLTQTVGVNLAGFYYWKNSSSIWIKVNGITSEIDPKVGSVTANKVPKWNGTNLVDGIIHDNSTNVGIGITNPQSKLEIAGPDNPLELKLSSTAGFGASRLTFISDKSTVNEWRPAYIESGDNATGAFWGRLDFFTNGTGAGNKFGTLRAMSISNGNLGIGVINPTDKLEVAGKTKTTNLQVTNGATANFVLQSDAAGNGTWVNPTTLSVTENDPQVSSTTTNSIPKYNGTTLIDGVMIDNGTNVGVGIAPSIGNKLEVAGKTSTTNLQMTTGATANFVLQSDAAGNGTWVNPNTIQTNEWYKESTTVPPTAITDDMYHTGNIAIGKNTADYPVDVNNTNQDIGINTSSNFSTSNSFSKIGFKNTITNSTSNEIFGNQILISGNGSGDQKGSSIEISNSGNATHYGNKNILSGSGSGIHYANYSDLTGTGTGSQIVNSSAILNNSNGVHTVNENIFNGSGSGLHKANSSNLSGSGAGEQLANENSISNSGNATHYANYNLLSGLGSGTHYANYSNLGGTGTGTQIVNYSSIYNSGNGIHNANTTYLSGSGSGPHSANLSLLSGIGTGEQVVNINNISNSGNANHFGNSNSLTGSGSGTHYANFSDLSGTGTGEQFGNRTNISNTASNNHYANFNKLDGIGNGIHYANYSDLGGSGSGLQYGNYNSISNSGSNNHYGIYNFLNGIGSGLHFGNFSQLSGNGSGNHYANYSSLSGTGTGNQYANLNTIANSGNAIHYGNYNLLDGPGTGTHYANLSNLSGSGTGEQTANFSSISNSGNAQHFGNQIYLYGSGSGKHYANSSDLAGNGTGEQFGNRTTISNTANNNHYANFNQLDGEGSGNHYANFSTILGNGTGSQYANYSINSNSGNNTHYGTFSELTGSGSGIHYNNYNTISGTGIGPQYNNFSVNFNSGNGIHYGSLNGLQGSGTGKHYGTYATLSGTGTGIHYGSYNTLEGTGAGNKYGSYNVIDPLAGGTHYGIYSEVFKTNSFAGYFLGNVAIGSLTGNYYIMPTSRGTANQIIQTDNSGNASWVNPTTLAITENDPQVASATTNLIPKWDGTTLVDGVITDTGTNIGIGTTNPSSKLEITSTGTADLRISSTSSFGASRLSLLSDKGLANEWRPAYIESGDNGGFTGRLDFYNNGTGASNKFGAVRAMSIANGNVGIGITNPADKLEVAGKTKTTNFQMTTGATANFVLRSDGAGNSTWVAPTSLSVTEIDPKILLITTDRVGRWNGTGIVDGTIVDNSTNVGIGITPTKAKLEVFGNVNNQPQSCFAFYARSGGCNGSIATGTASGVTAYSIYASDRIMASEFNAFSDKRIKNILGLSNPKNDLNILNKLKVTDYKYIDIANKGNDAKKGFIAQEVQEVFPEAVSQTKEFIPNIYQVAKSAILNGTTLKITLDNNHDLKVGDKVRLIADKEESYTVIRVTENTFEVSDFKQSANSVFVFGKEVSDFNVVDYDRIFTLGISAIQELSKENKAQKTEIEYLKKQLEVSNKEIVKRLEKLENK